MNNFIMMEKENIDDWDAIFMQEATLWSCRSHDIQTQCGCVIVKDKTVISTGYNGFVRDINDHTLPNTRPEKYPFMIHAESNAIYNAVRLGRSTLDSTIYITAPPCLDCLQMLYQCGVKNIIYSDISRPKMAINNDNYAKMLEMIADKISFRYLPKSKLSARLLKESVKKIKKK
jgi:dCMP deaminase